MEGCERHDDMDCLCRLDWRVVCDIIDRVNFISKDVFAIRGGDVRDVTVLGNGTSEPRH